MAGAATIAISQDAEAWWPHGSPPPPSSSFPLLTLTSDTGSSPSDNITNNNVPNIALNTDQILKSGDVVALIDGSTTISTHTITSGEANAGAFSWGLSALADGTHIFTATVNGGIAGTPLTVVIDTIAPTLSSAAGAQNGTNDTNAALSVTTNDSPGSLFWVVTASATPPTIAQVVAGQNDGGTAALANGLTPVSSTSLAATAFGLTTSGTRHAYFVHQDVAGNNSAVASSGGWTQSPSTGFDVLTTIAPNLWLAADDRFTMWQYLAGTSQVVFNLDHVANWSDKSGSAFNLAAISDIIPRSTQNFPVPVFKTSPRCVSFDGINDVLGKATPLGLAAAMTSHAGSTICMAVKPNPAASRVLLQEFVTSGSEIFDPIGSGVTTASTWLANMRNDAGGIFVNNQTLATGVFDNTWKVLTFIDDGTKLTARVNGVQVGTYTYSAPGTLTSANFALGNASLVSNSLFFAADIAELVIKLSGSISPTNLAHLETYMGTKIGLTI